MRRPDLTELSDRLQMFASQLSEAVRGDGEPPHPWRLDEWMIEYERAHPPPPAAPGPTLESLRGSVPDLTGGLSTREYLDRLRAGSAPEQGAR